VRPLKVGCRGLLWQAVDVVMIDGGLTKVGPAVVGIFGSDDAPRFQNGDVQRYHLCGRWVCIGGHLVRLDVVAGRIKGTMGKRSQVEKRRVTLESGRRQSEGWPGLLISAIDWEGKGKFDGASPLYNSELSRLSEIPAPTTSVVEARDPVWNMVTAFWTGSSPAATRFRPRSSRSEVAMSMILPIVTFLPLLGALMCLADPSRRRTGCSGASAWVPR
jgi:hypothetical protein